MIDFDELYRQFAASERLAGLVSSVLDPLLPAEVQPFSFVTTDLLHDVARAADLVAGEVLVDVGCGRGGPGMWLARRTDTNLIGVDVSAVAVAQARSRAPRFALAGRADFRVGELDATGLPDGIADAVVSIDAFQFAGNPYVAGREFARILSPGGRLVLTTWEARQSGDPEVPAMLARLDVAAALSAAGFDVVVHERPDLEERRRAVLEAVLAVPADGDPAVRMYQEEARAALPEMPRLRRVMAVARLPGPGSAAPLPGSGPG
ncbi:SAM-dependent methyltransferase [Dactylosporangium sucinum]|uniref:Methyltransferase type 11 domain-containing protein n=1 Tax=Dactylosporangium sucinum TaxID=1424081 RepID=A0A917TW28_9ACTN|nr:class I SAM-dependent methyltransferase [Dactylosporangium sucinum]GGM40910.1 hypothetical protein GCM10007977_047930 [Dactylosporangium sucinum]